MIPRTFVLDRLVDETGVSGSGIVAEGVLFSDGTCAMRWRTKHRSTATYGSLADLLAIHGHGGKTVLKWADDDDGCRVCGHPMKAHWMDGCGGCDVAVCDCNTMSNSNARGLKWVSVLEAPRP